MLGKKFSKHPRLIHNIARKLAGIKHDDLIITKTKNFKKKPLNSTLKFGDARTDHMLEIDQDNENGQHQPRIVPYHQFDMDPASSCLHYALQCFEGFKAYKDKVTDKIRLFRPDQNMIRMNDSCEALFFPSFDNDEVLLCIKELIRMEREQIPTDPGYSLYVRPAVISTHPYVGLGPAAKVKMFTILLPVGPFYSKDFSAIKLYANDKNVRAWPGGAGHKKIGGNYAPTILRHKEAVLRGYDEVLWLFGEENYVTEAGSSNQFFFWIRPDGKKELITAPLDGTILPGITRKSILEICREQGEFEVTERRYTIHEIIDAIKSGRVLESFASGTAAVFSPIKGFCFKDVDYDIPLNPDKPNEQYGPLTQRLADTIIGIQNGLIPHKWSVLID